MIKIEVKRGAQKYNEKNRTFKNSNCRKKLYDSVSG